MEAHRRKKLTMSLSYKEAKVNGTERHRGGERRREVEVQRDKSLARYVSDKGQKPSPAAPPGVHTEGASREGCRGGDTLRNREGTL